MGTKRNLAAAVAEQVAQCKGGPLLDAFAGMCAVGKAAAPQRQIWTNDLQYFASRVGHAFFCASELPPRSFDSADLLFGLFSRQRKYLQQLTSHLHQDEAQALTSSDISRLFGVEEKLEELCDARGDGKERTSRASGDNVRYDLFTRTFSGAYLGLSQCIEVDSIRFALDAAARQGCLSQQGHEWLCLSLGKAIARCSTSTGHFAQPLRLKPSNFNRYVRQRKRSVWLEWVSATSTLLPLRSRGWRQKNRSYHSDAVVLLRELADGSAPGVVYADPPYTSDQYSRYYHVYETLMFYDHPRSEGRGRYRGNRSTSDFSLKRRVNGAMEELITGVALLGSDIVISYPTNGLLAQSRELIPDILQSNFKRVHSPLEIAHTHSAMGASKGAAAYSVTEVIYRATA